MDAFCRIGLCRIPGFDFIEHALDVRAHVLLFEVHGITLEHEARSGLVHVIEQGLEGYHVPGGSKGLAQREQASRGNNGLPVGNVFPRVQGLGTVQHQGVYRSPEAPARGGIRPECRNLGHALEPVREAGLPPVFLRVGNAFTQREIAAQGHLQRGRVQVPQQVEHGVGLGLWGRV